MMLLRILTISTSVVCLLWANPTLARGPSTREERARVIQVARMLERDPLNPEAPAAGRWVLEWVTEVPDVRVAWCSDLLRPPIDSTYAFHDELDRQMLASAAAFSVEHPEKSRDDLAMYRAGVEGVLRAYETLLTLRPDAKSPFLDDLRAKRDHGELTGAVLGLAKKCKRGPDLALIATLGGAGAGLLLALPVGWRFGSPRVAGREEDAVRKAKRSQRIVLACVLYYILAGGLLHLIEPEFDPRFRFMSEYVWGAHGWLMVTTFFALALAAFTDALGLRNLLAPLWTARIAFGLLTVGAVFVCLAGIFKEPFPHLLASAVALPSLILGVLLYSWTFRRSEELRTLQPLAITIAVAMLVVYTSIVVGIGMPGLGQRLFLLLLLVWLALVARRSARVAASAATVARA